jgi:CDGSH-type Zn-finger protein
VGSIKVRQNGPYLVDIPDVTVIDWDGAEYVIEKRPFALCRCGHSARRPFCDGTHKRVGFEASEAAPGPAAQAPPAEAKPLS